MGPHERVARVTREYGGGPVGRQRPDLVPVRGDGQASTGDDCKRDDRRPSPSRVCGYRAAHTGHTLECPRPSRARGGRLLGVRRAPVREARRCFSLLETRPERLEGIPEFSGSLQHPPPLCSPYGQLSPSGNHTQPVNRSLHKRTYQTGWPSAPFPSASVTGTT